MKLLSTTSLVLAGILSTTAVTAADSRIVTMTVSFRNNTVFDYVTGQSIPSPFAGTASVSFNVDGPLTLSDYGAGSFVYYYGTTQPLNGAALSSSITDWIPQYVKHGTNPYNSYGFQLTYDYPDYFIEQFGSRTDASGTVAAQYYTTSLSIYTGLWGWQTPRNGNGTSDFFCTPNEVIGFLQSGVGKQAWFSQSYSVYAPISGGGATYFDGKIWEDYSAVITSVSVSAVPETSTATLALVGFAFLTLNLRRYAVVTRRRAA